MLKHATHKRVVDLTKFRSVPSPGRAAKSTEEVESAGHRLAELSHMFSKDDLPVVSNNQENREWIAEHSFFINEDLRLPFRFCAGQAEEDCHAFGCVMVNLALSDE